MIACLYFNWIFTIEPEDWTIINSQSSRTTSLIHSPKYDIPNHGQRDENKQTLSIN